MNAQECTRYLEDPEAHAAHLADCAECRAIHDELAASIPVQPIRVEALPLAPWEGAHHRSWSLVLGTALTVIAIGAALFAAAGASPFLTLAESLQSSIAISRSLVGLGGGVVQKAPILTLASFIVINVLLVALLRRAPKGIDA